MKTYTIEVRAIGYETLLYRVEADSKRNAQRHEAEAISQWQELNAIEDCADLAFTRVTANP